MVERQYNGAQYNSDLIHNNRHRQISTAVVNRLGEIKVYYKSRVDTLTSQRSMDTLTSSALKVRKVL